MVRFLFDKIEDIKTSGAANTLEEIAEAGRKAYCNLYENHPGWILMKNNIVLPIVKRTLDKMCASPDFTAPEFESTTEFSGGQCPGINYRVFYEICMVYCGTSSGACSFSTSSSSTFYGPIVGGFIREATPGGRTHVGITGYDSNGDLFERIFYDSPDKKATSNCPVGSTSPNRFRWDYERSYINITSIVPVNSGDVDNCGDPPGEYPPYTPPAPQDLIQDIDVTNIDGDTYTYNTQVNYDNDLEIKLPGSINVNQTNVTIDVGGITIGEDLPDSPSQGDDEEPDTIYRPRPAPQVDVSTEEQPAEEVEEDVENLVAVKVSISSIPANEPAVESGDNLAKIYPGWITFREGSYQHPRMFIDYVNNIFYAPDNADGYTVYLKSGYTGIVTKVVKT